MILDGRHLCQVANAQVIRPRRAEVDPDAHVPADFLQFRRSFTVLSASVLGAAATHIVGGVAAGAGAAAGQAAQKASSFCSCLRAR